jgi:geranylgeranyl diphosphate synthase type I
VLVAQLGLLGTPAEQASVRRHFGDPRLSAAGVDEVRGALLSSGALEAVEAMIAERATRARAALASIPLEEPGREVLEALVDTATARQA